MEYVNCNNCGQDNAVLLNEGPDLLLNRPGSFRLVRCRNCDLIYQNPRLTLEELPLHYPDQYEPYQRGLVEQLSWSQKQDRNNDMERRYKHVSEFAPSTGHVLDIGCATGQFLATMADHGWQATGVELSAFAADYARKTFNLTVHQGTLESAEFADASFDVITQWDVLEHVIDPKETLAIISRLLKPGGLYVASLPNPTAFEASLFGSSWVGWDRPRHLHLFTPRVLEHYLERAGLKPIALKSFSGHLAVTLLSLEFAVKARGWSESRWRPWIRLAYIWPLRLLSLPAFRLAGALNRLSVMTMFARKAE